jgi:hypothetical protein
MCTVQTAHSATRPIGHPATEFPSCATIPDPLYQISYSYHDHHRWTACCTYHLHTTRLANNDSPNETEIKIKLQKCPHSNSNLGKSMTHHNQTMELTTWFLTTPSTPQHHREGIYLIPCQVRVVPGPEQLQLRFQLCEVQ